MCQAVSMQHAVEVPESLRKDLAFLSLTFLQDHVLFILASHGLCEIKTYKQ